MSNPGGVSSSGAKSRPRCWLFRDGHKVISDGALVAITLMIAESDPKEKAIMTTMVMNLLNVG